MNKLKLLLALIMITPGVATYLIIANQKFGLMLSSVQMMASAILPFLPAFIFIMLVFLLTSLVATVSLSHKEHLNNYEKYGYFRVFGWAFIFTLDSLLVTFILTLLAAFYINLIPWLLSLMVTNIVQVIIILFASYGLIFKKKCPDNRI